MRKLLLPVACAAACAMVSLPLHGCIQGTACNEATIGGNAVTPPNR